jgi:hypothetical protein
LTRSTAVNAKATVVAEDISAGVVSTAEIRTSLRDRHYTIPQVLLDQITPDNRLGVGLSHNAVLVLYNPVANNRRRGILSNVNAKASFNE